MDSIALQQISSYAGGVLRQGDPERRITVINTDTRTLKEGELFLALKGERFDAHTFISEAARIGAAGAIIQAGAAAADLPPHFAIIEVPDTLAALQQIASSWRRSLDLKIVAITGSNGKTSTKDLAAAVLQTQFRTWKTEGNLNNHIGLPKTLLQLDSSHEAAVVELGMNHPGEIAALAAIARPDLAIVTNIGVAHIEYMGSREAIALEKGSLAEALPREGHAILPAADEFTPQIASRTMAHAITAGIEAGEIQARDLRMTASGSTFTIVHGDETAEATLGVPGRHMVVNALLAVGAGRSLGIPLAQCAAGLTGAQLTQGRLQQKKVAGLQFLDDSYNANPDSMKAALQTLAALHTDGRRIALLGRMAELGTHAEAGHREVGEAAAAAGIDLVLTVGEEANLISRAASSAVQTRNFSSLEEAADFLRAEANPADLILIKGSRSSKMEQVLALLEQQTEEAR